MWLHDAWGLIRRIERLLEVEAAQSKTNDAVRDALADLDRRLSRLEHREDLVALEAKSAARAGAQEAMQGVIVDITRRVTLLESAAPVSKRLKPPKT